jgi:predicted Zn-dependent protease
MTNLLVEVVHHIAGETSQHVRLLSEDTELKMSPEKQARDISQKLEKRDLLAIVLLNFPEDKATFRSAYFPRERVALIDVGWLRQTGEPGQELDEVRLRSRFMKEALRALGKLLGMKDCPFPRCCMQLSSTYIELDSKAMDFCPPCQAVAESALAEAHSR